MDDTLAIGFLEYDNWDSERQKKPCRRLRRHPEQYPLRALPEHLQERIPLDIVENILDHVRIRQDLKTCCLVCLSWLHPSRQRLNSRSKLRLTAANLDDFLTLTRALSDNTKFAPAIRYVQNIYIEHLPDWHWSFGRRPRSATTYSDLLNCVFSTQKDFKALRTITLLSSYSNNNALITLQPNFPPLLDHLVELQMYKVYFDNLTTFVATVSAFPHLKRLVLSDIVVKSEDDATATINHAVLNRLRILELHGSCYTTSTHRLITEWLICKPIGSLHSLSLHGWLPKVPPPDDSLPFFKWAGQSLERVKLFPVIVLDFRHNLKLREIEFGVLRLAPPKLSSNCATVLCDVLQSITSTQVEKLLIRFGILFVENLNVIDWAGFSAVLTSSKFSRLRKLEFSVSTHPRQCETIIREKLGLLPQEIIKVSQREDGRERFTPFFLP